ncbi:unnamed protein product [Prunus armeniaca]
MAHSTARSCLRLVCTISLSPLPICPCLTSLGPLELLASMLVCPPLLVTGSKVGALIQVDQPE